MSSVQAQVSAPCAGMQGQPLTEAEVPARSKATGVVRKNRDDRGICHLGPMEVNLRSLECREQNRSYRGHGLRMLQGNI